MRRIPRVLLIASALTVTLCLAGCESFDALQQWDPSDLFGAEFFNSKKKLPGERKPVFPEGVPGVAKGVPPDLVKGNEQQADLSQEPPPSAEPIEPKPKAKPKPKPKVAARPAPPPEQQQSQSQPTAVTARPTSATPWPEPPATAPQSAAPPVAAAPRQPAGGQIMWPDPPPPPSH